MDVSRATPERTVADGDRCGTGRRRWPLGADGRPAVHQRTGRRPTPHASARVLPMCVSLSRCIERDGGEIDRGVESRSVRSSHSGSRPCPRAVPDVSPDPQGRPDHPARLAPVPGPITRTDSGPALAGAVLQGMAADRRQSASYCKTPLPLGNTVLIEFPMNMPAHLQINNRGHNPGKAPSRPADERLLGSTPPGPAPAGRSAGAGVGATCRVGALTLGPAEWQWTLVKRHGGGAE
jgi:hypothetical protein